MRYSGFIWGYNVYLIYTRPELDPQHHKKYLKAEATWCSLFLLFQSNSQLCCSSRVRRYIDTCQKPSTRQANRILLLHYVIIPQKFRYQSCENCIYISSCGKVSFFSDTMFIFVFKNEQSWKNEQNKSPRTNILV